MNFEVNLIFLIKPFFLHDQKIVTKNLNILRTKRAFQMKQKAFFIIFKGFSIKQIKQVFLEGESPTLKKTCFSNCLLPSSSHTYQNRKWPSNLLDVTANAIVAII